MLEKVKVPMPTKHIIKRKNKANIVYIYYVLKSYRNEKGQPTCDSISIGKLDKETGMLVPNDNYFDYFDCELIVNVKGEKNEFK